MRRRWEGGQEDVVCDSVIHEVQFDVNCQMPIS